MLKLPILILISIALFAECRYSYAAEIEGDIGRIKDADSFYIWNTEIRLIDIDAFEYSQKCRNAKGQYQCGVLATKALQKLVKNKAVRCVGEKADRYQRLLATCYVGKLNLNEALVAQGWALNYKNGTRYAEAQTWAKSQNLGAWQGEFIDPYDYRRRAKNSAIDEQEFALDTDSKQTPEECIIKGNISTNGDKIYHTPWGSASYARTRISTRYGEKWFCSEQEAEASGWRAPKR